MSDVVWGAKGFTVVELMITVAVIGILAAIAAPNYSKRAAVARQTEAKVTLSSVYQSELLFSVQNLSFTVCLRNIGINGPPAGSNEAVYYLVGFQSDSSGANLAANSCGNNGQNAPCNQYQFHKTLPIPNPDPFATMTCGATGSYYTDGPAGPTCSVCPVVPGPAPYPCCAHPILVPGSGDTSPIVANVAAGNGNPARDPLVLPANTNTGLVTATVFKAGAYGQISASCKGPGIGCYDIWTIDNTKTLANTQPSL